jgi:hypothetical protein
MSLFDTIIKVLKGRKLEDQVIEVYTGNISESMRKMHPNNCPVLERTADGDPVGVCWFAMKNGVCPRHGKVI